MILRKIRESLGVQTKQERIPITKPAQCLGQACLYFSGEACEAREELLEAKGKSGQVDLGPYKDDCSYALYGKVCTGSGENVVVELKAESPNDEGSPMELVARMGMLEGQTIILTPRNSAATR